MYAPYALKRQLVKDILGKVVVLNGWMGGCQQKKGACFYNTF